MKNQNLLIISCLALAITGGSAHASTIILTDNFNESPSNEDAANFNNNLASTQGGTLSTVTYNVQGGNFTAQHSNGGTHLLVANDDGGIHGYGNVSLNNDFATQANAANQALQVSFNIGTVFGYAGDPTRWIQFNLGNSQNLDVGNATVGAAVLFRANGGTQALSGGAGIGSASTWSADDLVTITLSGTGGVGSAFNGNGSVASISIGANNLGTFTLAQQTNAYVNFSAFNYGNDQFGGGSIDNLSVAVVPEPSAAILGGLGMLALLRRRRA